jgi:hypothetical protein
MYLLVPCSPKAFWTGLTPRWYRAARINTLEKLDMVRQTAKNSSNERRRRAGGQLAGMEMCGGVERPARCNIS